MEADKLIDKVIELGIENHELKMRVEELEDLIEEMVSQVFRVKVREL